MRIHNLSSQPEKFWISLILLAENRQAIVQNNIDVQLIDWATIGQIMEKTADRN